MSDPSPRPKRQRTLVDTLRTVRGYAIGGGLLAAIAALVALGFAPFGVHELMFDLDYALGVVALGWSWNLALLAVGLGGLALLLVAAVPPRRGFIACLAILALGAGVLAVLGQVKATAGAEPPVHDVSTDWTQPLLFGPSLSAARGAEANAAPPDPRVGIQRLAPRLEGMRVAELNARGCPGAVPAMIVGTPDQAFAKAREALLTQGYELATENPAAGRLEATTTTRLLKLRGDVVVRVRPEGAGARIDIRSVSRTGEIDLGENCRRVTLLRQALNG